jgi:Large eukaryotic DNA virus major capsid protein/Major capsid protein N-terminus
MRRVSIYFSARTKYRSFSVMEKVHVTEGRGAASGALTALAALGPQEKYMFGGESLWVPELKQHSPFTQTHRLLVPLQKSGGTFFMDPSRTVSIDIKPKEESGDLLSNMYLSTALPALPFDSQYGELVGRAIIKKAEFLINGVVIESIEDDWYIIRDQLFLDADEKLAMYQVISAGQPEGSTVPATTQVNLMIPLDFFFCRRRSHNRTGKHRGEKPYLPLCAMHKDTITVRFQFNNAAWITNAQNDVYGNPIDLINPRILVEEITLSDAERVYYMSKPISYRVVRTFKEAVQDFQNGTVRMNFTANFPVSMIAWFIRNKLYEQSTSTVPVTFFNGVTTHFIDSIQSGVIFLNNQNILTRFPGALYYSYHQPLQHYLSVPTKNIYMYCFGENPKEYDNLKYIDFSKYDSQTSHLDITFDPNIAPQIEQSYNMYLYYLGYSTLKISGGTSEFIP